MTRSSDHPIHNHPIRKLLICLRHPFDQWNVPTRFSERLRQEFPQINVVHLPDYKRVDEEIVDAEIVIACRSVQSRSQPQRNCDGSTRLPRPSIN